MIFKLIFALALFISITFYASSLNYYFFQDDFFEINISKANDVKSYLDFFKFRDDIIAYRPISLQNYFFISKSIFGLNPTGFRFVTFIFFLGNAYLITKIVSKLASNNKIGLLTASLWLTSSAHFMSISWIAAAYNIIGTFFWLLTTLFFLSFLEKKSHWFYLISIVLFLLTIGSFEFSVTLPIILGAYSFYLLKNNLLKTLKILSPFLVISIAYLILRVLLIKVPQIPEYKLAINIESIKALFWYFLWSFNIPEEFKKQVVNNLIVFNQEFLAQYSFLVLVSFATTLLILTLAVFIPLYKNFKHQKIINARFLLFTIIWFIVGISPVLVLPNHTFIMYLTLSSIGIYMFLSYLLIKNSQTAISLAVFVLFLISSIVTLHFYKTNFWMIESQKFSREFTVNIKKQYPTLAPKSIIFYQLGAERYRQSLLGSNALQAIYNDASLTIYYNKSDLENDINSGINRPVYIYPQ